MKRKVFFLVAFVVMCAALVATLTMGVLAADEEIVVRYYETQSGSMKEKAVPNADGTYTMRATQFSKASTVNLTNGAVSRELYGWFTEEGDFYTPGQTVSFRISGGMSGLRACQFDGACEGSGGDRYGRIYPAGMETRYS